MLMMLLTPRLLVVTTVLWQDSDEKDYDMYYDHDTQKELSGYRTPKKPTNNEKDPQLSVNDTLKLRCRQEINNSVPPTEVQLKFEKPARTEDTISTHRYKTIAQYLLTDLTEFNNERLTFVDTSEEESEDDSTQTESLSPVKIFEKITYIIMRKTLN